MGFTLSGDHALKSQCGFDHQRGTPQSQSQALALFCSLIWWPLIIRITNLVSYCGLSPYITVDHFGYPWNRHWTKPCRSYVFASLASWMLRQQSWLCLCWPQLLTKSGWNWWNTLIILGPVWSSIVWQSIVISCNHSISWISSYDISSKKIIQ